MIEKFSDEELKQIMKELGIKEKGVRPYFLIKNEIEELEKIQKEKPEIQSNDCRGKLYESVRSIVTITMNVLVKTKKGYWRSSNSISEKDSDEY